MPVLRQKAKKAKTTESYLNRRSLLKILKISAFALGSVTLFFYFFSFIGLIIGILFVLFSKRRCWKINGAVLAFSIALSSWVSNSSIELAPLKLAAATGPTILIGYFTTKYVLLRLRRRSSLPASLMRFDPSRFRPAFRKTIMVIAIIVPLYMWQAVNIDYGVLFNNSPQLLWVHAPTSVDKDSSFEVTVQCWDPYERLSAVYDGTVLFELESYDLETLEPIQDVDAILPGQYTFSGQKRGSSMAYAIKDTKDNGNRDFDISIGVSGIHYVKVTDVGSDRTYYSNPIIVDDYSETDNKIYWGDIHTHSSLSDGSGSMEHNSYYAKEIACLDFMGFTDHAEILIWKPGVFDYIEEKINELNQPGSFVVFQGFEWTQTADGHYSIIFSGEHLLKRVTYLNTPKPQDLWDTLDDFTDKTGSEALALPHHTTKKEYIQDWTYIDPDYVRIAEVASTHGYFLLEPWDDLNYRGAINPPPEPQNGTCIMDAIEMGNELTLYAASDSHDGFPGHTLCHTDADIGHQRPFTIWLTRNEKPYCGGITAVYSPSLTRASIFSSLKEGKIYASGDYGRPYLDFCINGNGVYDSNRIFLDSRNSIREIQIVFAQDGAYTPKDFQEPIDGTEWYQDWDARIEIFKNGYLWRAIKVDSPVSRVTVKDGEAIEGAEYGYDSCVEIDGSFYINRYSDQPVDPGLLNTKGADFYIVRTVTEDGREAYAGPIWVTLHE